MKILVIDDIGYSRALVEGILTRNGHTAVSAESGMEALEILSVDGSFGMVLCDLMMPEIDGIELFKRCRKLKRYRGMSSLLMPPFVLMTASNDQDILDEALKIGFTEIIKKPFEVTELKQVLSDIQSGKHLLNKEDNQMKILVVDAKGDNKKLISNQLDGTGHIVLGLSSGQETLDILAQDLTIGTVICNLDLPDMDALKLYEEGGKIERFNDSGPVPLPPFILIADTVDIDRLQQAKAMGFTDVLINPIDPERLSEKLFEIHHGADEAEEASEKKILVVDDVGFSRSLLEKTIQRDGHSVVSVSSAFEALEQLRLDKTIAVVVCDLMMPDMDGIQLYKEYQEMKLPGFSKGQGKEAHKIPFILITASSDYKRLRTAEEEGFFRVHQKPVDPDALRKNITELLTVPPAESGSPAVAG